MSCMLVIALLLPHTSLITPTGHTSDFGNILSAGCLEISPISSLVSRELWISGARAHIRGRRFLFSINTAILAETDNVGLQMSQHKLLQTLCCPEHVTAHSDGSSLFGHRVL